MTSVHATPYGPQGNRRSAGNKDRFQNNKPPALGGRGIIVEGQVTQVSSTQDAGNKIRNNPKFHELVRKRTSFAWTLSAVMLAIYFGFILLIAYGKSFLGSSLSGGVTTIGFPIGVGVILAAIALTGVYVRRANTEFDELNRQIIEEAR